MFLRTAGRKDIDAIRDLLKRTWHATYDRIYGPERVAELTQSWHSPQALEKRLADPKSEFILADDGQQILGVACGVEHGDHVDLKQLYVSPEAQGRGIGAMLLQEIVASFEDAHAILLEVEAENLAAIGFYKAQGFDESARRSTCNDEPGFETILMVKQIS